MPTLSFPYPPTPENVDPRVLDPSADFKRDALRVLGGILCFIFTYVLLIALALALAVLCAVAGLGLIAFRPMLLTVMVGLGFAGLGIMVVFFLVKFLFKSHKIDRSGLFEVKKSDQPKLFEFVARIAKETQTPLPKRIYVSADVNASVFYDSTFWSMFFPVRKNLQIGLGLVNAVTLSEFKAIIAHEFGHFSQRSMKLGSYVYHMNQIIFNLLHDNEGYENTLQSWANASWYFSIFAVITIRIVNGIQWVLRQVYALVNKQYMSLSRQMEFHADTISASVSGADHLITSLHRLEVADITYNNVFEFYRDHFKDGLKPDNIYPQHKEVMRAFASFHRLPMTEGLPQINADSFKRFNKTRIAVKDQWASHPSTDDREAHLRSLNIQAPSSDESAWVIFDHQEKLQTDITNKIFESVKYENAVQVTDEILFKERYQKDFERYQLPKVYKGFFDSRIVTTCDLRRIESMAESNLSLEDLLAEEVLSLPYRRNGIQSDIETLKAMIDGRLRVNNFDFDGRKYRSKEAAVLLPKLEQELNEIETALSLADQKIVGWFIKNCTQEHREKLRFQYSDMFLLSDQTKRDGEMYNEMQASVLPLYQPMPVEQIQKSVAVLKKQETEFKKRLEQILQDPAYVGYIDDHQREEASKYLSKDWDYFSYGHYIQASLDRLNGCLYLFLHAIDERLFQVKADLLRQQLQYLKIEAGTEKGIR